MSISYNVYNFPSFPISKQIFFVPGAYVDGGFTTGGARIGSPDVSGFSALQIQPSLQVSEWLYPVSSWLQSKTNGQILRIRLAPTPQIASVVYGPNGVPWSSDATNPNAVPWSNGQDWAGDFAANFTGNVLEGSNVVTIDMSNLGRVLQQGHVIGHKYDCYLIDDISYDANSIASITLNPPLRRNFNDGDPVNFRPYFTGMITNPSDITTTYDAESIGFIQLPLIKLAEVVL